MTDIWEKLAAPFGFDDLKVMPQTLTKNMDKALAVAYFDARAVMNRLDEVLTPACWRVEYREAKVSEKAQGMICRLTVIVDGVEVVREDGSDPSDIEGFKGAISGALKRAFSALGNRSLYDTDLGWQPIETYEGSSGKKFKGWTDAAMNAMRQKYEKQVGKPTAPPAPAASTPEQPKATANEGGKNAFGYAPVRWPLAKMFDEATTESQQKMARSKMRERMMDLDEIDTIRRLVLTAFQIEDNGSKACSSLFIDWLINADDETLDRASAAAEAEPRNQE